MSLLQAVSGNYGGFGNVTAKTATIEKLTTDTLTVESLKVDGPVYVQPPKFVDDVGYEVQDSDYIIICTEFDDFYLTLPNASTCPGRSLIVRSNTGYYVYSEDNNIAIPGCGEKYSAITSIIVYDWWQGWAELVSDGTYWILTTGYAQAYCD